MFTLRYKAGNNPWNTADLRLPSSGISGRRVVWVVYLHGGAWRDVKQTKEEGHKLLERIPEEFAVASIDYRLSIGNGVRHPAHMEDVATALSFLHTNYDMDKCILVGHSCGATLAIQVYPKLRRHIYGLVLLNGIYDLEALVDEYPEYNGFVEAAFGPLDRTDWSKPSPTSIVRNLDAPVRHIREQFLVCHSQMDELLSMQQSELFLEALADAAIPNYAFREIHGKHDDSPGSDEVLGIVLEQLDKSRSSALQYYK
ncbi:hypothetical protein PYCC9005_003209 [Savitreella phatthalungensis]